MARRKKRRRLARRQPAPKKGASIAKFVWPIVIVVAACFIFAMVWRQGDSRGKQQWADLAHLPLCPIGETPVNFAVSTQTDEGPVFFCCAHCVELFNADPGKYDDAVQDQRRFLERMPRTQVRCPVSGGPARSDVFIERGEQRIYFQDEASRAEFVESAGAYDASLRASYTYQTKCPVSVAAVEPAARATASGGEEIYFCSLACRDVFLDNPGKFAAALRNQGIRLRQ